MNSEEQILIVLTKLLEAQEQTLAVQKQLLEGQQKSVANQEKAIKNQLATGKIYRISLFVLALVLLICGVGLYWSWNY